MEERDLQRMRLARDKATSTASVHHIHDTPKITAAVNWLKKTEIEYRRPTPNHFKIGTLSFYPNTGTLNFDNRPREHLSGLAGLKALLESMLETELPSID
jgi:hypothetical protein